MDKLTGLLTDLVASWHTVLMAIGAVVIACETLVRALRLLMTGLAKIALLTPTPLDDNALTWADKLLAGAYQSLHTVSKWIPRATVPAVAPKPPSAA